MAQGRNGATAQGHDGRKEGEKGGMGDIRPARLQNFHLTKQQLRLLLIC